MKKGFVTYLLLFLAMIIGAVLICLTIMIFSPGVEILGYEYYSQNSRTSIDNLNGLDDVSQDGETSVILDKDGKVVEPSANPTNLYFTTITQVVLKTNVMNVNFIHGEEDRIYIFRNVSGFVKSSDVTKFVINKSYDSVGNILTITANDVDLLLNTQSDARIDVIFKNQTPLLNIDVEISEKADVAYAQNEFSNQITKDLTCEGLTVNSKGGNIVFGEDAKVLTALNLKSDSGKIEILGDLKASTSSALTSANFEMTNGDINTQELYINNVSFKGTTTFVNTKLIGGNVDVDIVRGELTTGVISGNFNAAETVKNLKMEIDEVTGNFTVRNSESGAITANKVGGETYIRTTTGEVNVKEACGLVDILTTAGNVRILFNSSENAQVKTTNGAITALFKSVLNSKTLNSTSGVINAYYLEGLTFKMVATSEHNINLKSENLTFADKTVTGYPTQADTAFETTNVLTMTTSADINVEKSQSIAF